MKKYVLVVPAEEALLYRLFSFMVALERRPVCLVIWRARQRGKMLQRAQEGPVEVRKQEGHEQKASIRPTLLSGLHLKTWY